jgi:hypothetical protein
MKIPPARSGACHRFDLPALSRRDALRRFGIGFGGLALSGLLADAFGAVTTASQGPSPLAPKATHFAPRAKRVIFLFMHGGPSHVDTFDYKPQLARDDGKTAPRLPKIQFAVAEGRDASKLWKSPWSFQQCGRSGIFVSELFPHVRELVDDLCIINSLHGTAPDHGAAVIKLNTGSDTFVRPSFGAWCMYGLGTENQNLPGFITISPSDQHGGVRNYGSAFLPAYYQGTPLGDERTRPGDAAFRFLKPGATAPEQRRQLDLLRVMNEEHFQRAADPDLEARIASFEMAFRMQTEAPEVLDLSRENAATRALYGLDDPATSDFGTQCLLARRMAESGVRFIQVSSGYKWDQHGKLVEDHPKNARAVDKPIAGLLRDLKQRGLLEDTLVLWGGEFGRTPTREGGSGRDHNPHGFTMWLAGGGVKGGIQYGRTDEHGYYAVEDKMHLHDLHATLLALLGLDHERLTYRYAGRDFRLTDVEGHVAREIFA